MAITHTLSHKGRSQPSIRRAGYSRLDLSRLILSGTTGLVFTILVVWMLMVWIFRPGPSTPQILAATLEMPRSMATVTFTQRDAQAINTWPEHEPATQIAFDKLKNLVAAILKSSGRKPVTLYVGALGICDLKLTESRAPVLIDVEGRQTPLKELFDVISKRDDPGQTLLLLDLSTVSNDRNLDLFANSVIKRLEALIPDDPNVVVIASCAPGQQSWVSESEGRSVFGYYISEWLAGAKGTRGRSVEDLLDYVRPRVANWVALNRSGAIQTPLLLSKRHVSIQIPRLRTLDTAPIDEAKLTEARTKLLEEWKERQKLANSTTYRDAPVHWSHYQQELLATERRFRAGHDIERDLEQVGKLREAVQRECTEARLEEPWSLGLLRRESSDDAVAKAYEEQIEFALTSFNELKKPVVESAEAGFGVGKPSGPADPSRALAAARKLLDELGRPIYIEAQILEWYEAFVAAGGESENRKADRLTLLRKLIEIRKHAEQVAVADARIVPWIRGIVDRGDKSRRKAQDLLFASDSDAFSEADTLVSRAAKSYDEADETIRRLERSYVIIDRAIAELPYLGEWLARRVSRAKGDKDERDVENAFKKVIDLLPECLADLEADPRDRSETMDWARDLETRAAEIENGMKSLSTDRDAALKSTDWREIDALLHLPMLEPAERRELLERVGSLALSPSLHDAIADGVKKGDEPDLTLRDEATKLARLEVGLLRVAGAGSDRLDPSMKLREEFSTLEAALRRLKLTGSDPRDSSEDFEQFSRQVRVIRTMMGELIDPALKPGSDDPYEDTYRRKLDRFSLAARALPTADWAKLSKSKEIDLDRLIAAAKRDALRIWHAQRLCEDFDPGYASHVLNEGEGQSKSKSAMKERARSLMNSKLTIEGGPDPAAKNAYLVSVAKKGELPEGEAALFLVRARPIGPEALSNEKDGRVEVAKISQPSQRSLALISKPVGPIVPKLFYRGTCFEPPQVPVQDQIVSVRFERVRETKTTPTKKAANGSQTSKKTASPASDAAVEENNIGLTREPVRYKLSVKNITQKRVNVVVSRKLIEIDGSKELPLRIDPVSLTLGANETKEVNGGVIEPANLPEIDVKTTKNAYADLMVNVTIDTRDGVRACDEHGTRFIRMNPKNYIGVPDPGRDNGINPETNRPMQILQLVLTHKKNDPADSKAKITVHLFPNAFKSFEGQVTTNLVSKGESFEYKYWIVVPDLKHYRYVIDVDDIAGAFTWETPD